MKSTIFVISLVLLVQYCTCAITNRRSYANNYLTMLMFSGEPFSDMASSPQGSEKPCCLPRVCQFTIHAYNLEDGPTSMQETIYQNGNSHQLAAIGTVIQHGRKIQTCLVVKFEDKSRTAYFYMIDKEAKVCNKRTQNNVTYDEVVAQLSCIPKGAEQQGSTSLGISNGASLQLNKWIWNDTSYTPISITRYVTKECAPVLQINEDTSGHRGVVPFILFSNIQTKISDPKVFDLPPYCPKQDSEAEPGYDNELVKQLMAKLLKQL